MLSHEMIKSLVEISGSKANDRDDSYFHIAYGVDEKFLYGVGTSISSILIKIIKRRIFISIFWLMT